MTQITTHKTYDIVNLNPGEFVAIRAGIRKIIEGKDALAKDAENVMKELGKISI